MKLDINVRQIRYDIRTGLFPSRIKRLDDALIDYIIENQRLSVVSNRYGMSRQALFQAAERYRLFIKLIKRRDKINAKII